MNKKNKNKIQDLRVYENTLKPLFEKKINQLGYNLENLLFVNENDTNYLRVTISHNDHPILIGDCEQVSAEISTLLDEKDPISFPYLLEVESPGINHLNKENNSLEENNNTSEDNNFEFFLGKHIMVKTNAPVKIKNIGSTKELEGILRKVKKDSIKLLVAENNESIEILFKEIVSLSLVLNPSFDKVHEKFVLKGLEENLLLSRN